MAGINCDLVYHMGRHTFGSLITLEAGVPIETISKMLGHTNLTTTQLYARVTPKKLFEDMDKFIGQFAELCDIIVEKYQRNIVFLSMQMPHDVTVSEKVRKK